MFDRQKAGCSGLYGRKKHPGAQQEKRQVCRLQNYLFSDGRPVVELGARVKGNILLVDDNDDTCLVFNMIVQRLGFACARASNGSEALVEAQRLQPDIIFMDYMMPIMDGLEASRLIKAQTLLEPIPIIFYTATLELSARALEAGASEVLLKPANISSIQNVLYKYLER